MTDNVNHPDHYGGGDDPYEVIKVIEAWGLGFHLGNVVKYVARAGKKDPATMGEDIDKAAWYLERFLEFEFEKLKKEPSGGHGPCTEESHCVPWRPGWKCSTCVRLLLEDKPKFATGGTVTTSSSSSDQVPLSLTGCTYIVPATRFISVYTDIADDQFKQYSIGAQLDWSISTLASLVATGSKEWASGSFSISVCKEPEVEYLNPKCSVAWLLEHYPPSDFNYYLRKTGL